MLALALLALQVPPPSPAPPPPSPPPTPISVASRYDFVCDVTALDGSVLTLKGPVKGAGSKRQMQIANSLPARFPSGKAMSAGAQMVGYRQIPTRYFEPFRMARTEGRYTIVLWWRDGAIDGAAVDRMPPSGFGPVDWLGRSAYRLLSLRG